MANKKKQRKAVLLGVGLDSDGHKRVTTGLPISCSPAVPKTLTSR
jgi:hypothetical protein